MDPTASIGSENIVRADGRLGLFVGAENDEVVHGLYRRTGTWAPALLDLLSNDLLPNGGTLLDIGANIGLVAIPATERCPIRTLAFEPDPRNAELLRRNVALHSLETRIGVHQVALFSAEGAMTLARDAANHGDHRLVSEKDPARDTVVVQTARLDSILADGKLVRPLVAKIDTQGAEVDVLKGARETLSHTDYAIVEVWPAGLKRLSRQLEDLINEIAAEFRYARLLLEGKPTWPLASLDEEFARLQAVPTLEDEDTFFDILVGRAAEAPYAPKG